MGSSRANQNNRFADLLKQPLRNGLYKPKDFHGRGTKIVNMGELFANSRIGDVPMRRLELTEREIENNTISVGDLLFARRSLVAEGAGRCAIVTDVPEPTVFESSIIRARPDPKKVSSRWLYYFFMAPQGRSLIQTILRQMAVSGITVRDLAELSLPLPDLKVQDASADVLELLDDRVDLLRQTNKSLEAIAQALFNSWFVNFDPVRAKAEGRKPEGMDAATAALFPEALEVREGAASPVGWSSLPIYDLAQFVNGAAYKAFAPNHEKLGLPIIKIAELKNGVTEQTAYSDVEMPEKYRVETGDMLFSWSGNPDTSIDTFVWPSGSAWLNQHIFRVLPHEPGERSFVQLALKYLKPTFAEIARNKQTTGLGHVTVGDLKRLRILKPNKELLEQWNLLVDPMLEQIFVNEQRAKALIELRDALLPRLVSGKLQVPEAEREVEAIA